MAWTATTDGSLFHGRRMKPAGLEAKAIQALINRDVEHIAVVANSKLDITRDTAPLLEKPSLMRRSGCDERQLLASWVDYQNAWTGQASRCDIEVPLGVDPHP